MVVLAFANEPVIDFQFDRSFANGAIEIHIETPGPWV